MNGIDWVLVTTSMFVLCVFAVWTSRHTKSVADFLSANRSAGRYLLALAVGMANFGAISIVSFGEMHYKAGFSPMWWRMMLSPVMLVVVLTGWIYYRFRETRCLTVAQFFEIRYSKAVRVYAGIVIWVSGIVNFGIFPAVSARFFVYFCGFPNTFEWQGMVIPTYIPIMLGTLGIALAFTYLGGFITVMVTDCVQGIFVLSVFFVVCGYLLYQIGWTDVTATLSMAPENASQLNPYKTSEEKDFGLWYYIILITCAVYSHRTWQGSQGYFSAGLNPHETKMGGIIEQWRLIPFNAVCVLLPVCMIAFMALPRFAGEAAGANQVLSTISSETIRTQMTVPVALAYSLPVGLKGLFCAAMLFALIANQDAYMHSWGCIFVQDVLTPILKKPLSPKQHVLALKWSVVFVAVFALCFSILFPQFEYIFMFFAITSAMIKGLGALMIGGLYWKWGTTAAAWVSVTLGWVLSLGRIVLKQIGPRFDDIQERGLLLRSMDILNSTNSQWIMFWVAIICMVGYVLVSLITCRKPFDLHKMLHRGQYEVEGEHVVRHETSRSIWLKITGITKEFSYWDRVLAIGIVVWNLGWVVVFIAGTIYNLFYDVPNESWAMFWKAWLWAVLVVSVPITIWFCIGGILDVRDLFVRLKTTIRDDRDDGTVRTENKTPGA